MTRDLPGSGRAPVVPGRRAAGGVEPGLAGPPLGIPSAIRFDHADPHTFTVLEGGGRLAPPVPPQIVARIDGDGAGVFTVTGIETLHLVRDPDAHALNWETLTSVDGVGPIDMTGAQAIGVLVGFGVPDKPQPSYSATCVLAPPDDPSNPLMVVPVEGTANLVGHIRVDLVAAPGGAKPLVPGGSSVIAFVLDSTLDHEVDGSFSCLTGGSPFTSPSLPASVAAFGRSEVVLPIACAPGTAPGVYDGIAFGLTSADPNGNGGVSISIKVFTPRTVELSTDLPQEVQLEPGASVTGTITVQDSGGLSDIAFRAGVLPDGIRASVGPTRVVAGGPLPDSERIEAADLTIAAAPDAAAGLRHTPLVLDWTVPSDITHPQLDGTFSLLVDVLAPRGGPGSDDRINWELATPFGIQLNVPEDGWNAGRVHDVISLPGGALLVGAARGGVWTLTPAGSATAHSDDWHDPDVNCLARGLDDPSHFYAGCDAGGALYESLPGSPGFLAWREVPIADAGGTLLSPGNVLRIAVVGANRKLVLACQNGVFWADIPQSGGFYAFRQALGLPAGTYSGATPGPGGSVAVGAWGDAKIRFGIFLGNWASGDLVFTRMIVPQEAKLGWISLASCDGNLDRMYAAASDAQGRLVGVLCHDHARDGMTWRPCDTTVAGAPPGKDLLNSSGDSGFGGWIKMLAVSPTDPDKVVLNWARSWINFGGGQVPWQAVDQVPGDGDWTRNDQWYAHMHEDGHTTVFDVADERVLYIATDGGVGMTPDLGATYASKYNQLFATLMVDSQPSREGTYGTLSAGPPATGLVAAGLQDNSDVYCTVTGELLPWRRLDGGDGKAVQFLPVGQRLLWYVNDGEGVKSSRWNGAALVDTVVIPRTDEFPRDDGLKDPVIEVVEAPLFRDAAGRLMVAVGCADGSGAIYGLFADDDGGNPVWTVLGELPPFAGGSVRAIASLHGDAIWIGTSEGRIFSMGAHSGAAFEFTTPRSATPGEVHRFLVVSEERAYAVYNTGDGRGLVLQQSAFEWDPLGSTPDVAAGAGLFQASAPGMIDPG